MSVYKEVHLPQLSTHARVVSAEMVTWVGRFTLWCTTAALFLSRMSRPVSRSC